VMTKNENNFLPLSDKSKILVTGPTANLLSVLNGGWTFTWQGNEERIYPQSENTVLEAIKNRVGQNNVKYLPGSTFEQLINIDKVKDAAEGTDVIIACLGEPAYCEGNGNINDLTLDSAQLRLVDELSKTGKPIVLVMLEGRPRLINSIVDKANSILVGFLPGMKGGNAIADIIFGKVNPSGKLPVTYPKFPSGFTCYDYKPIEDFEANHYDPQWAFGYGLSYTTFEYSDLKLNSTELKEDENLSVSVKVKNTGTRTGKEIVQLYVHDLYGSVSRPMKQLKGFEKVELKPGESREITFTINPEQLSFIGRNSKRIIEPGDFEIYIADLKAGFKLL
jgi:beta-glucosidase